MSQPPHEYPHGIHEVPQQNGIQGVTYGPNGSLIFNGVEFACEPRPSPQPPIIDEPGTTILYDGLKHVQETRGIFKDKFIHPGRQLISVNGDDYAEYRVLVKIGACDSSDLQTGAVNSTSPAEVKASENTKILWPSTTGKSLTSFSVFSTLPVELKFKVWKEAYVLSIFVVNYNYSWPKDGELIGNPENDAYEFPLGKRNISRRAINNSKESRQEALKSNSYQLIEGSTRMEAPTRWRDLIIPNLTAIPHFQFYVNFSIDTIFINNNWGTPHRWDQYFLSEKTVKWEWVQKVEHLAIDLSLWSESRDPCKVLRKFPKLKEVTLCGGIACGYEFNDVKHNPSEVFVEYVRPKGDETLWMEVDRGDKIQGEQIDPVDCTAIMEDFATQKKAFLSWEAPVLNFGEIKRKDSIPWCFKPWCPNTNSTKSLSAQANLCPRFKARYVKACDGCPVAAWVAANEKKLQAGSSST